MLLIVDRNLSRIDLVKLYQGCTTSLRPRVEIRKLEARRAESGGGVLGRGTVSPSPPAARGSGERCKLPQWGSGRSPALTANAFWCSLSSEIASGSNFFNYLFKLKS